MNSGFESRIADPDPANNSGSDRIRHTDAKVMQACYYIPTKNHAHMQPLRVGVEPVHRHMVLMHNIKVTFVFSSSEHELIGK